MLLAVSHDYIVLGKNLEDRRQLLYGAVSAWNIACLPISKRKRLLKKFMAAYKEMNPTQSAQDHADVESDMRQLIKKKVATYPDVHSQIIGASLNEEGRHMHVTVASIRV